MSVFAERKPATSSGDVLALLSEICRAMDTERVPLGQASGRVLRETVRAAEDQPPFDRSSVDGYAVRLDDGAKRFRVVDEIRAGEWKPRQVLPGEAVRVATGGGLPCDGLRVVMKEDASVEGDQLTVLGGKFARNIRFRGEDAREGQVLAEPGLVLGPGSLALLASVGCSEPLVTRLPRVLHLTTGNEIVPPDQTPKVGQIRDSNSTLVRAFFEEWGSAPKQVHLAEERSALQTSLAAALAQPKGYDLVLVSGGASVGEHDFTRPVFEELGFTIRVSRTSARPGKPLIVAQRAGLLAFGLPGNPLAHYVCLNLYVRAALETLSSQARRTVFEKGELGAALDAGNNQVETFWPAQWALEEGVAVVRPLRWASSGDLTTLAATNALVRVKAGTGQLAHGVRVDFIRTERD